MDKVEMEINLNDLKMLQRITENDEKTKKEQDIINSLHKIYNMRPYYEDQENRYYEIAEQRDEYNKDTIFNLIEGVVFASLMTFVLEMTIKNSLSPLMELGVALGSSAIGAAIIQYDIIKEKMYDVEEFDYRERSYMHQNEKLREDVAVLIKNIIEYLPYYNKEKNWENLSTQIFDSNKNYIEEQKSECKIGDSFNKEKMTETLEYFFGDIEVIDIVIQTIGEELENITLDEYESPKKQIKRLRK